MRRFFNLLFFIFKVMLLILFVSFTFSCQKISKKRPNIILIIPDALRAKQLPCYGYKKIETVTIDDLVKNSVIFQNCFVRTPGTQRSFSDLFTGSWSASSGLKNNEKTLAQYLKEHGYYTVGFVSSRVLMAPTYYEKTRKRNEFNRGFDEYIQDVTLEKFPYRRKSKDTTADIINWLDNNKNIDSPFFLFAHYMDPHGPYNPSYDGEIEMIDNEISKIIEKLKELSLYDNSIFIFTSDHGDSLNEHNSPRGHGWFIYTEQIQVPLIIKFPKNKYIKPVTQIIRNIDIMPTILSYINAKYEKNKKEGKSLLPAIRRNKNLGLISYHRASATRVCPEGSEGVIFSEGKFLYQYIQGIYSDRYREIYNISVDPDEKRNLYSDSKHRLQVTEAKKLLFEIKKQLNELEKSLSPQDSKKIDKEEMKALKSLGYISDGAPPPYIKEGPFLMYQNISQIGLLRYSDFIRKSQWSHTFKDEYYPLKIITLDNDSYYIITNKNRELFRYNKKQGFKFLGINNIQDIALDNQKKILYIVQNGEIKILELDSTITGYKHTNLNNFLPCQGIHVDTNNNIYIFKKEKIVKFDSNKMLIASYDIPNVKSNLIAVDGEENIFIGKDNKIIKFSKKGSLIETFRNKEIDNGICSIAIDKNNQIWVLEKKSPSVIIFDRYGKKIESFTYNNDEEHPLSIQLFICQDRIYIIDSWEGIIVYSLS